MSAAPETPLAIYTERLPQVRRVFKLYLDRVEVDARWTLGGSFRNVVKLADLSGQTKQFWVRNRWFGKAVMLGSICFGAAVVFARDTYPELVRHAAKCGWPLAGFFFIVAVFCFPKRLFIHFPRSTGRPGLDVCRSGPDRARFEGFVEAVQALIRKV